MRYWCRRNSLEVGPFGKGQLLGLFDSALAEMELRQDDSQEWQAAATVVANWQEEGPRLANQSWPLATCVATEVVKRAGWSHIPLDEEALALRSGAHLLVIVPRSTLTVGEVEADMERWYARLRAGEWKSARTLDLLYCLPTPASDLQPLRKRRKVDFLGRHTVRFDFVDPDRPPTSVGSLDRQVSEAVGAGVRRKQAQDMATGAELLDQLVASHQSHGELEARLAAVKPWGSYATLGICLAMFVWGTLAGGTENALTLLRFGADFSPLTIGEDQWWRLYGCTFLHIGIIHLACNMITLLSVGAVAEQVYGNVRYLALYAISGLCGSLASVFTSDSVSAGASGALFGVCGAVATLGWRHREQFPPAFGRRLFQGMLPMIGYNLLYGFSNSGVDNAAHLGGLLAGGLFALLIRPQAIDHGQPARPLQAALLVVAMAPFVVQGWAIHNAIFRGGLASYPQRTYSDPSGDLEVNMPAIFETKTVEGESFFQGPGMAFSLQKLDDPNVVVISNPTFLEAVQQAEGTISVRAQELAGRTWVLREATIGAARVYQGFAYIGTFPVKVEVAVGETDLKEGDLLRSMLIQSMRRKSYDQLNQGKALAKMGLHSRALQELAGVEETVEVGVLKVDSLVALSRYEEAEKLLLQLEQKHSNEPTVRHSRWSLLEEKKDYPKALAACQEYLAKETDAQEKFHRLVDQADLLERLGRPKEAQPLLAQARNGYKDKAHIEADILNCQAWRLIEQKRYLEALPVAERALKAEENSSNLDTRGRALLELGRLKEAKADFEKILNEDVNKPYANYAMARILQGEGDLEKARIFYFRYFSLAGENGEFAKDTLQRLEQLSKAP